MRIAVIGSSGQLGTDLLALWGDQAVGVSHVGIELSCQDSVERALDELAVDVVVNAAAYNQVDEAEREPGDAMAVNSLGPRFLARGCPGLNRCRMFVVFVGHHRLTRRKSSAYYAYAIGRKIV